LSSLSGAVQEDHPQDLTLVFQSVVTERSEELKHVMMGTLTTLMDAAQTACSRLTILVSLENPQSALQFVEMERRNLKRTVMMATLLKTPMLLDVSTVFSKLTGLALEDLPLLLKLVHQPVEM
jgi:hypothetical protein